MYFRFFIFLAASSSSFFSSSVSSGKTIGENGSVEMNFRDVLFRVEPEAFGGDDTSS